MKAITLHQPWASLVASGHKTIETRSWAPPLNLKGQRIAIHASKRRPARADLEVMYELGRDEMPQGFDFGELEEPVVASEWVLGSIVATAKLAGVWQVENLLHDGTMFVASDSIGQVLYYPTDPYGDFSRGRWLWELADVEPCWPPIPATGRQRLWNWNGRP